MDWTEKGYNAFMQQCGKCKHYNDAEESAGNLLCTAFPDGIPEVLSGNRISHSKPYPGDHGIMFELIEKD